MFDRLLATDRENGVILAEASEILGRDLHTLFHRDNSSQFQLNRNVQVGVFLTNYMYAESLRRRGVHADYSLGLSLGEYNHLVDIGALSFRDAVSLLEQRGAAYECAPEGVMTAVFPVDPEDALEAVGRVSNGSNAAVAMFNAPRQCVLSGDRDAVESASAWLVDETGALSTVIEPRLPMHSPLFRQVGEVLQPALQSVRWRRPAKPYVPNLLGRIISDPSPADLIYCLSRHPWLPVLWRQSVEFIVAEATNPIFVEVGPKSVLHDMLGRRWISAPRRLTDAEGNLAESLDKLAIELTYGRRALTVAC
jgi:[acyl-carrier-protein] S-malonyltransferase